MRSDGLRLGSSSGVQGALKAKEEKAEKAAAAAAAAAIAIAAAKKRLKKRSKGGVTEDLSDGCSDDL